MKAVLLEGGLGTRIAEESDHRPKPMIELGGRPILWHIMKIYAHHGITDFIVCCGYRGYMIKEYFANYRMHNSDLTVDLADGSVSWHATAAEPWRVTLVDTGLETMTGGRLRRIAGFLDPDEPFCMTYGDGVADIDITRLVAFHRAHGRAATLTAVVPPGRYGALEFEGERVARFIEKPPGDNALINGGFFVLHPSVIGRITADDTPFEAAPLTGLAADGELMAFRHTGFWRPMDTLRDKRQLEELWERGGAPWKVWA
ncbi:glucose-1-phosphate cytidylyltransferase [Limibaculum sp. FT325]|uniref:glucose-1-phosphate cytidylyltransferase n=1 Tax=Thermohalobaculum sediminis TaxID=2939436 RepID=UPI0020BFF836|nr:glucose-1-phosphate cytidylyltransferase [Limibaculum sediminis]MCL5777377.1 glucose-1-phosphate cytidylyltransferase [Limibaculum sediminis]